MTPRLASVIALNSGNLCLRERGVEITYAPFEDEELHALLYKPGLLPQKLKLVTRGLNRRWSLVRKVKRVRSRLHSA